MGVPSLFVELVKKYKNIIFHNPNLKIDSLYLDYNCGIHPACYRILEKYPDYKDTDWLEDKMLDEIISYLDKIIKFVKPSKLIYLAIDGPAPVAKMKQQRQRRYKSAYENKRSWNNSKITPGTQFMIKITRAIKKYFRKNIKNIKVIFSDSNVPSEGEHKIFQHILKTHGLKYCIYGLDADLIFLGLSSQKTDVYLLREADYMNLTNENRLDYFSIDLLKNNLYKNICSKLHYSVNLVKNNVVNDFIVLCFLLGNDFLPHMPALEIRNKGIDILLDSYLEVIIDTKTYLINQTINWDIFMKIINKISVQESTLLINNYKKNTARKHFYDKNTLPIIQDIIKYDVDGYKERYYIYHFGIYDKDCIEDICFNYLKSILWNYNYYFKKCCSWQWHYIYDHPPLLSDLKNHSNFEFKFILGKPLQPLTQLLIVLPIYSKMLLPKSYQNIMYNLIDLYPDTFKQDYYGKVFEWQGIPLLPPLNINRIFKETQNIKLDIQYNKIGKVLSMHL